MATRADATLTTVEGQQLLNVYLASELAHAEHRANASRSHILTTAAATCAPSQSPCPSLHGRPAGCARQLAANMPFLLAQISGDRTLQHVKVVLYPVPFRQELLSVLLRASRRVTYLAEGRSKPNPGHRTALLVSAGDGARRRSIPSWYVTRSDHHHTPFRDSKCAHAT